MTEFQIWLEGLKAIGLPAAVLFAWWYHNREQNKLWSQMLDSNKAQTAEMIRLNSEQSEQTLESYKTQNAQMLDTTNKLWGNVMDIFKQQLAQQNDALKGLLDSVQYNCSQLARVESKIDTNQTCPIIRATTQEPK